MQKHKNLIFILMLSFSFTSCLKTRAQLNQSRDYEEDTVRTAPPVQEIQHRGQYFQDEVKLELTHMQGRLEDLERSQKQQETHSSKNDELDKLKSRIDKIEEEQFKLIELLEKSSIKDPEEIFKTAQTFYRSKKFEDAITKFESYLKIPKVKKADEATFMKAECLYELKSYKKAIVEYSKFPEKFKKSNRMPEALYKIAQSFESLGMSEDAQGFYQELIEKYPKSPEAKKSKKKVK